MLANKLLNYLRNLNPEQVREAIARNIDLSEVIFQHFRLNEYAVKPVATFFLRTHWDELEPYLTNVKKIMSIISENNKEAERLLKTPAGRKWLNWNVKHLYETLYYYAWGENAKPRSPPFDKKDAFWGK